MQRSSILKLGVVWCMVQTKDICTCASLGKTVSNYIIFAGVKLYHVNMVEFKHLSSEWAWKYSSDFKRQIFFLINFFFSRVSVEIRDCFGFAFLCSVIGPETSCRFLDQSVSEQKPLTTLSLAFSLQYKIFHPPRTHSHITESHKKLLLTITQTKTHLVVM